MLQQKNTRFNNMIIDANIILRWLLQDNYELAEKAKSFIDNNDCFAPTEVIAEVVFVLVKVYGQNGRR